MDLSPWTSSHFVSRFTAKASDFGLKTYGRVKVQGFRVSGFGVRFYQGSTGVENTI